MKKSVNFQDFLSLAYDLYDLEVYPKSLSDIPTDILNEMYEHYEIKDM